MITLEDYGVPLTYEHHVQGDDLAAGLTAATYKIDIKKINFDSGGTTAILAGNIIVGATSSATALVLYVSDPTGATTWAGGDAAGYFYVTNIVGTFENDENLNSILGTTGAATENLATVNGIAMPCDKLNVGSYVSGMQAKTALLTIETQAARFSLDGLPPTPATHANGWVSRGIPMATGTSYLIRGINNIKNFKICNSAAGSNTRWTVVCFF